MTFTKKDNQGFRGQTQGEDWCWLHGDSLKGLECGMAMTRAVRGRSPSHHRSEAPLLSGAQSGGWWRGCPSTPFSTPQPLPPWAPGEHAPATTLGVPAPDSSHTPVITSGALGADASRLPRPREGDEITAEPQVT